MSCSEQTTIGAINFYFIRLGKRKSVYKKKSIVFGDTELVFSYIQADNIIDLNLEAKPNLYTHLCDKNTYIIYDISYINKRCFFMSDLLRNGFLKLTEDFFIKHIFFMTNPGQKVYNAFECRVNYIRRNDYRQLATVIAAHIKF